MTRYKKLINQPLTHVLAEFRYSSVLKISEYIPEIQDRFRREYPNFLEGNSQAIQVEKDGSVKVSSKKNWVFVSADKRRMIEVDQDRLFFATTSYDRFGGFSEACKKAIEVLAEVIAPNLLLSVGLRYSDFVEPGVLELKDLLSSNLLAAEKLGKLGDFSQRSTQSVYQTEAGVLSIKSAQGVHNAVCFNDISHLPLEVNRELSESECVILDFDHRSGSPPMDFDAANAVQLLGRLHESSRDAFWETTTEKAREDLWG